MNKRTTKELLTLAMQDLFEAGVITFLDRELVERGVKQFGSVNLVAEAYLDGRKDRSTMYPAEIHNIRNRSRKWKTGKIVKFLAWLQDQEGIQ